MLKSLNVCKVYLQCWIVIQRVVTKHGLPSVQLSRMKNLKIWFAKNKFLGTIWSPKMNQTAWTYPAREHYKNAYFLWLYNSTHTWFMTNFLQHYFDAWLQKTCDAAGPDIPLHWYKLNWHITCDLPESWTVLSGAFLFLLGILSTFINLQFVIKIFVLSIFESPFYTGLTVLLCCCSFFIFIAPTVYGDCV